MVNRCTCLLVAGIVCHFELKSNFWCKKDGKKAELGKVFGVRGTPYLLWADQVAQQTGALGVDYPRILYKIRD